MQVNPRSLGVGAVVALGCATVAYISHRISGRTSVDPSEISGRLEGHKLDASISEAQRVSAYVAPDDARTLRVLVAGRVPLANTRVILKKDGESHLASTDHGGCLSHDMIERSVSLEAAGFLPASIDWRLEPRSNPIDVVLVPEDALLVAVLKNAALSSARLPTAALVEESGDRAGGSRITSSFHECDGEAIAVMHTGAGVAHSLQIYGTNLAYWHPAPIVLGPHEARVVDIDLARLCSLSVTLQSMPQMPLGSRVRGIAFLERPGSENRVSATVVARPEGSFVIGGMTEGADVGLTISTLRGLIPLRDVMTGRLTLRSCQDRERVLSPTEPLDGLYFVDKDGVPLRGEYGVRIDELGDLEAAERDPMTLLPKGLLSAATRIVLASVEHGVIVFSATDLRAVGHDLYELRIPNQDRDNARIRVCLSGPSPTKRPELEVELAEFMPGQIAGAPNYSWTDGAVLIDGLSTGKYNIYWKWSHDCRRYFARNVWVNAGEELSISTAAASIESAPGIVTNWTSIPAPMRPSRVILEGYPAVVDEDGSFTALICNPFDVFDVDIWAQQEKRIPGAASAVRLEDGRIGVTVNTQELFVTTLVIPPLFGGILGISVGESDSFPEEIGNRTVFGRYRVNSNTMGELTIVRGLNEQRTGNARAVAWEYPKNGSRVFRGWIGDIDRTDGGSIALSGRTVRVQCPDGSWGLGADITVACSNIADWPTAPAVSLGRFSFEANSCEVWLPYQAQRIVLDFGDGNIREATLAPNETEIVIR